MPLNRLSQVFDTLSIRSLPNQTANLLDVIGTNGEQIASLTSTPFLMIGSGVPNVPLHIRNSNSSYSNPLSLNVPAVMAENLNNASGTANALLGARVGGSNGGDPFVSLDINGVIGWSIGLDNSDSDKFKISESWSDVGVRPAITLSPGSIFSLNSTSLNLGASSAAHQFAVVSNASTNVVSVFRGAASQTADVAQWQNSAGTSLTSINSSGHFLTPRINFTGGSTTISALTLADGTVSFEGTAGQLFSVSNSLTGTIFSINDISGLPSVEVTDLGIIKLNELYGQTVIGSGTPATNAQLSAIARTSATIPLVVRGASGQSVNLQEWQNNTPTTVASISNTGAITAVDLTLSGNLTVNGTTTNINTVNLVVEDKNIVLGDVASPSTTTADGGGLTLLAGGSNKTFNWINATDRWTSSVGLEGTSIVRTGGTSSQFLKADGSVDSSAYITAAQTFNLGTTSIALNRASAAQSLTGITSIDGSAATLTTSRNIGDVAFNGSTNIVPERIFYKDTRATNYNPFTHIGATLHLKTNTTDSLADGGTYHGVLDLAHWTDSSGGVNHQLGLTDNGNMWIRYSTGASTWSSWSQFAALTSTTPSALGSAAVGTAGTAARADHVHPTTGLGLTSGTLAQFAATTSAQLAGVISDETGSGSLVFALAPTIRDLTISRSDASIEGGQISLLKSIDNTIGFNIDVYGSTASPDFRIFNGAGNQVITFTTAGAFSVPSTLTTGGALNLNYASPAITSNNASAASIFTSTVTGITIGSSTIRTTAFPADGTTSTAAASEGYMGMPQVAVSSGGRTLAASDAGKHIYMTTTSGQTLTIPANGTVAFPIGTTIVVVNGSGISTSIAITTDTLRLANSTSTGTRTLASNGMCTLLKIANTEWIASGNGLT